MNGSTSARVASIPGVVSRRIADNLRAEILRGEHAPGVRLRQEDIAERFEASRIPVREALRMLESDGLVTLIANTGAWISVLSLAECEEMYQMRERIDPLLLRFSIPNLSDANLDRLDELVATMEHGSDVEQFLLLDREFHMLTYSGAQTVTLASTVERLWNSTQHYRRAFTRLLDGRGSETVHHEHHLLAGAIRRRDSDDAERLLFGHIRRTRLELERHPEIFH